ncbi:peptidase M24, structural domain-containing protein [Xylariaceae sp. FL1019]|nr:peptidase M24, structural domain-containing protein [Xylariaceae sp. FL1019]
MKCNLLPIRQLHQCLKQKRAPSYCLISRSIVTIPSSHSRRPTPTTSPATPTPDPIRRKYYSTPVSASNLLFGQPVHETHPHILAPGELTPGITAQEYHSRRAALLSSLPANSAVILPSSSILYRSGAVFHAFRQETNFLYLTGWSEPDSLAILRKTDDDYEFTLLCRPKNPKAELWGGPWSGLDAARDIFNADVVGDISSSRTLLAEALQGVEHIYTDAEQTKYSQPTLFGSVLSSAAPSITSYSPLKPHINALRAIKSTAEIAAMRRAGQLSGRALTRAMSRSWSTEKELAAFLEYTYQTTGLDGSAYIPVVAGGSRGSLIHYVHNNASLTPHNCETILVDAGGEYGSYIADITRVWPLSGKFTPAQRDLYNAVLSVQRSVVSLCRASANMTLDQLHGVTERGLRAQLADLGFELGAGMMDALFPHHVGHYVGLDVHDVPGYPRNTVLKEGHCIAIEPGVYVPDDERFPEHFRGLAVRIEDSVCVGDDNPLILTTEAVKEVVDIEALRD